MRRHTIGGSLTEHRGTVQSRSMAAAAWPLLGAVLVSVGCSGTSAPAKVTPSAPPAAKISPEAKVLLDGMAGFFKGLKGFAMREVSTTSTAGSDSRGPQTLDSTTERLVLVERPNRLLVTTQSSSGRGTTIACDGSHLAIHQQASNKYESGAAPAAIAEIIANPLVAGTLSAGSVAIVTLALVADDLPTTLLEGVRELTVQGTEVVEGRECQRLVARTDSADWELWIATGEQPLPVKFVPRTPAMFFGGKNIEVKSATTFDQWRVEPVFEAADFSFNPPEGAEKVDSLLVALQAGPGKGGGPRRPALHPMVGFKGPPVQLVGLDGTRFDSTQASGKVVVLDFWATWCPPCREGLPVMARIGSDYAEKGVVFRAVNVKEEGSVVRQFLEEAKLDLPVVLDETGKTSADYRVDGIPQTVIIGGDGLVQAVHVGFDGETEAKLRQQLDALLEGKSLVPALPTNFGPRGEPL